MGPRAQPPPRRGSSRFVFPPHPRGRSPLTRSRWYRGRCPPPCPRPPSSPLPLPAPHPAAAAAPTGGASCRPLARATLPRSRRSQNGGATCAAAAGSAARPIPPAQFFFFLLFPPPPQAQARSRTAGLTVTYGTAAPPTAAECPGRAARPYIPSVTPSWRPAIGCDALAGAFPLVGCF